MAKMPPKVVYVVHPGPDENHQGYWKRCGVAFVNRDNSLSLRLDLFPGLNIQIRDEPDKREPGQEG